MSEGRKFQLNIKFGGGYEAPLLNIEGDTQDEFAANVEFALASINPIVDAATAFQVAYELKKPKDEQGGGQQQQRSWSNTGSQRSSQNNNQQGPSGPAPECRHGEMKYVPGGFSKRTNKPYNAFWSCTGPRNDQCDTQPA